MSRSLAELERDIAASLSRGDLAAAAAAAAECRAAWPSSSAGWLLGSIVALFAEDGETALALIEERLKRDPADAQCLLQKAEALLALGRRAEALEAADAAADGAQGPAALDAVGEFLAHAGDYARALQAYERAVAAAPRDPTLLGKRASIHRALGRFDLAATDYQSILRIDPGSAVALKGLAELNRQLPDRNLIGSMEAALAGLAPDSADAAVLHFGLAKCYEDLGDHAANWRHLRAGNRIERSRIEYSPRTDLDVIDGTIEAFRNPQSASEDTTGERPIFIVGLPRTGTTLVDRILSSHSQVHSMGEVTALSDAIEAVARRSAGPYATDLRSEMARRSSLDGAAIAREYLERVRVTRGERPRFTDKQLTNFLNCALILRAFPGARIIHLTRHPLAACYAIYRTRFKGTYPFAYDLEEIAAIYVGYRRLMHHWHRVLPGRILDVSYEELVAALEPTTRRVLEFAGLPFERACLDFHTNPAPVITTSSVQVRQPLYASSVERWRNYVAELAPVRERLQREGIPIE